MVKFLSPDPAEGGEKPPAAALVVKSDATEQDAAELVKLQRALADKDKTIKERETRLSELEDENRRLKTPPAPKEVEKAKESKWAWLNGV
jgi:uncharacterized protein (DUF3084 family)